MTDDEKTARIRELNDELRTLGTGKNIRAVMAGSLAHDTEEFQAAATRAMRNFTDFNLGDDPYGQHDFGAFNVEGKRMMFKIDYFSLDEENASDHPEDPNVTIRVLSLFYADDY